MKHIIVIETSNEIHPTEDQRKVFESDVVEDCEGDALRRGLTCVVRTSFFQPSAVNAVCEMYGNDYRVGQENKSPDNGNEGNHVAF
jgi:hypothetical protein